MGSIIAVWILSHSGLNGNEEADQLAKRAAREALPRRSNDKMTYAAVKNLSLTKKAEIECDWWRTHCPATYRALMIEFRQPGKYPNELQLPRAILGSLLAARTGHGDSKAYHERFHHEKI